MTAAANSDARKRLAEKQHQHAIRWEFDEDTVRATAICNAPEGADCRLEPADPECECEEYAGFERRDDGTFWHALTDGYRDHDVPRDVQQWHQMKPGGDCNVIGFLNADPFVLPEMGEGRFVIAETPIETVWNGDDYEWKQATR
jgi:hypothetical protein